MTVDRPWGGAKDALEKRTSHDLFPGSAGDSMCWGRGGGVSVSTFSPTCTDVVWPAFQSSRGSLTAASGRRVPAGPWLSNTGRTLRIRLCFLREPQTSDILDLATSKPWVSVHTGQPTRQHPGHLAAPLGTVNSTPVTSLASQS